MGKRACSNIVQGSSRAVWEPSIPHGESAAVDSTAYE